MVLTWGFLLPSSQPYLNPVQNIWLITGTFYVMTCTPVKFIDTFHYTAVTEWSYMDGRDDDDTKDTNKKCTETYTHLSIRKKERKERRILLSVHSSLAQISLQIPQCCRRQTTIKGSKLYNKSAHYHVKFHVATATATNNSSFWDVTPYSPVNSTRLSGVTSITQYSSPPH